MKPAEPPEGELQKKRLGNLLGLASRARPEVGVTPAEVVFSENKWRLLRYDARPGGPAYRHPILMVPSLINRHYVLDLMPGKSMAEWLVKRGHDVFCIDWGTPGPEDRYLDLRDIADLYLGRAVRVATRLSGQRPNLLGYCMGGTLATVFATLHSERIHALANMAAPIRFDDDGLLAAWSRTQSFDVDALVEATGIVPWELLQSSFHMLRPTMNLGKVVNLVDRAWNDPFLDGFFALETWANDNVGLPGEFYRAWIKDFYIGNRLWRGTLTVGGRDAILTNICCPTLAVTFEQDNIAPAASCECLIEAVGATDKQVVRLPGSHIGGTTSSAAAKRLWPVLSSFFGDRDDRENRAP
jgi:polyhydroxyalkanoate synthase